MVKRTLGQVRPVIARVAANTGLKTSDIRLNERINQAIETIITSEDYPMITDRFRFSITNGLVVMPFDTERILQAELSDRPVPYRSGWYEFIETLPFAFPRSFTPIQNKLHLLLERGSSPVKVPVPNEETDPDYKIVIKGFTDEVTGVAVPPVINIRGFDENGVWIRTDPVAGQFIDGENLAMVAGSPFEVTTVNNFSVIDSITKPITKQHVKVIAKPTVGDDVELSDMRYQETVPAYHTYFIPSAEFDDPQVQSLLVRVKTRFVPLLDDNDILPISNLEALQSQIIAQHKLEVQKPDDFLKFKTIARQLLWEEARSFVGKQKKPAITFTGTQTIGGFRGV